MEFGRKLENLDSPNPETVGTLSRTQQNLGEHVKNPTEKNGRTWKEPSRAWGEHGPISVHTGMLRIEASRTTENIKRRLQNQREHSMSPVDTKRT